jgi:hypothetical protein
MPPRQAYGCGGIRIYPSISSASAPNRCLRGQVRRLKGLIMIDTHLSLQVDGLWGRLRCGGRGRIIIVLRIKELAMRRTEEMDRRSKAIQQLVRIRE